MSFLLTSQHQKARLILPQQQTIREILDFHGRAIVVQPDELPSTVKAFHDSIRLVITDSQAFSTVKDMVPEDVPLTSFSILFARYKGELEAFIEGANELKRLKEGDPCAGMRRACRVWWKIQRPFPAKGKGDGDVDGGNECKFEPTCRPCRRCARRSVRRRRDIRKGGCTMTLC